MHLHQQIIAAGTAIDPQFAQGYPRVVGHGAKNIGRLQRDGLQRCPGNMGAAGAARNTHQRAARMAVPIRRAQPGKGGYQVHIPGVGNLFCQRLHLFCSLDDSEPVAQPLDGGTGHKHRALQRIAGHGALHRRARADPGHGGQQLVPAGHRGLARIHEHEASGAIGVFRHPGRKTGLPESCGLLVPGHPGNRQRPAKQRDPSPAQLATAGHHLWQHRGRDAEQRQQLRVPLQRMDVEQQRARGIARIGHVPLAASEFPDQPAVHGAEGQLALFSPHPCAGHMVQQPLQLGRRKVRVQHQPGLFLDHGCVPLGAQLVTASGGAPVLPDNSVGHRFTRLAVPQHRGFALVGNAYGVNRTRRAVGLAEHLQRYRVLRTPDLASIVFHPTRVRENLPEFPLRHGHYLTGAVEQDGA